MDIEMAVRKEHGDYGGILNIPHLESGALSDQRPRNSQVSLSETFWIPHVGPQRSGGGFRVAIVNLFAL